MGVMCLYVKGEIIRTLQRVQLIKLCLLVHGQLLMVHELVIHSKWDISLRVRYTRSLKVIYFFLKISWASLVSFGEIDLKVEIACVNGPQAEPKLGPPVARTEPQ